MSETMESKFVYAWDEDTNTVIKVPWMEDWNGNKESRYIYDPNDITHPYGIWDKLDRWQELSIDQLPPRFQATLLILI
jgi:hypothetical protein